MAIARLSHRTPCPRPPSQKRVARPGIHACFLFLSFLFCFPAWAQDGKPASVPAAVQPDVTRDALGRTTPRGTVLGFVSAARNGNDELAARYLDTRLSAKNAAVLAHQLFTVLDRRLPPRLNELSNAEEGSLSNPLKPDRELVGTITSDNGNVDIFLDRVNRGKSGSVWLFSNETLSSIPELFDEVNVVSVDQFLPKVLVDTRLANIALFEWLGLFVGLPSLYFLSVLVTRGLNGIIGLLRRRWYKKPDLEIPAFLPVPVRLLFLASIIHWMIAKFALPLIARQFWSSLATVITIAATVWLLIIFNGWGEEYLCRFYRNRRFSGMTSLLRLARRAGDVLILFGGVLVIMHHFRVNATAALAGLGVGGIAVAFAAQKTLENVIGGISLIFDKAVRVEELIKVGDHLGTVNDIGLRSTRIRTLDRTIITVPNGQIATMTLEDLSLRDKFRFHSILALGFGTSSKQICAILEGVRSLLKETGHVEPAPFPVRFLRCSPFSLDVEISAYVMASSWNEFLEIQEKLLLHILECVESNGVRFAFPQQAIVAAALTSDAAERAVLNVRTSEKRARSNAPAVESA